MPIESRIVLGQIEGYDVIYVPQKDLYFCKNTIIPLTTMEEFLKGDMDRVVVENKNLTISRDGYQVTLGCLTTNTENLQNILKETKKLKKQNYGK